MDLLFERAPAYWSTATANTADSDSILSVIEHITHLARGWTEERIAIARQFLAQFSDQTIANVIARVTRGPFCHVEVRLHDGHCFSAHFIEGVRWARLVDVTPPRWECISIPWQETTEALAWASSIVGWGYDTLGAILSGFNVPIVVANRSFCSRVVAEFLSRSGVLDVPVDPNPNKLYQWAFRVADPDPHPAQPATASTDLTSAAPGAACAVGGTYHKARE